MAKKFEQALLEVVREMGSDKPDLCMATYRDNVFHDNATVMLMELGGYACVHDFMQDLHDRLSAKLGHPVSICHNHPEDESILIHGNVIDATVYDRTACCKDHIDNCLNYLKTKTGYRTDLRATAEAAAHISEQLSVPAEQVLNRLNWDCDPLPQLIKLLLI